MVLGPRSTADLSPQSYQSARFAKFQISNRRSGRLEAEGCVENKTGPALLNAGDIRQRRRNEKGLDWVAVGKKEETLDVKSQKQMRLLLLENGS
jgi:hypothetical protein